MGSVGHERQVSRITGMLSCNKWTMGHLGVRWQVKVAQTYGWMTWRLEIGGKSRNKRLVMSERDEGLTTVMGGDVTWEQVEQVESVEDDVPE
jgi:hypothetical protein